MAVVPASNNIEEEENEDIEAMMQNMDFQSQMNISSVRRLPAFYSCQINNL